MFKSFGKVYYRGAIVHINVATRLQYRAHRAHDRLCMLRTTGRIVHPTRSDVHTICFNTKLIM